MIINKIISVNLVVRGGMFVLVVLLLFYSCELDTTVYPPEPSIEFKSSDIGVEQNSLGQEQVNISLTFYVIDGDGDVGLTQYDIDPPYDANFFPLFYGIKGGEMHLDTTFIADKYRIPYVGDLGQDKTLKAFITVDFEYPYVEQYPFPYDSVVYSFYMVDRALNKSNTVWSDTIVISGL